MNPLHVKVTNELSKRGQATQKRIEKQREELKAQAKKVDEKFTHLLQMLENKKN